MRNQLVYATACMHRTTYLVARRASATEHSDLSRCRSDNACSLLTVFVGHSMAFGLRGGLINCAVSRNTVQVERKTNCRCTEAANCS